jgi:general secretion pathway protein J
MIRARRAAGFTLLELVVVLGIFAFLSAMAYGGLNSVLSARERVAQSLARTMALQKAYVRLRNDFQQLRARPARDGYGEAQPALLTQPDRAVEFTRAGWRNPLAHARASLERVAYRFDDDRKHLVRASWIVLDRAQNSRLVETVILEQVDDARWRFLDPANQWQDTWPQASLTGGPAGDAPPRAVELTLELADLGEVRLLFGAVNNPAAPGTPGAPGGKP